MQRISRFVNCDTRAEVDELRGQLTAEPAFGVPMGTLLTLARRLAQSDAAALAPGCR